MGWIAVDLDGVLAHYDGWKGIDHVGDPIPAFVDRVKNWLAEGKEVRVFTARVCPSPDGRDPEDARRPIREWCLKHVGVELPITHEKDPGMIVLYDDRCRQVETNTGRIIGEDIP